MMSENKIKWQLRLLRLFCRPEYLEEIEGELLEKYERNPSRWLITIEVIKLIRPRLMKNYEGTTRLNYYGLFKNQLTTSLRFTKREKAFTLMNVTGLSLGMVCCAFIYVWLSDEIKYNSHLTSGDRVCNVLNKEVQTNGQINTYRYSSFPLKEVLDTNYPIVESSTIMSNGNWMAFQVGEDLVEWAGVDASPEVFDIFEIDFLKGGPAKLYNNPDAFVISRKAAEIHFGKDWEVENIIGTIMEGDEGEVLELAGVYEDLPYHSTLRFDFVLPFTNRIRKRPNLKNWTNSSSQLYVKIRKGVNIEEADIILQEAINDNRAGEFQTTREIFLQPFEDMYLFNRYERGTITGGRIDYVRLLSVAAVLVLVLASINFMNLTTVRATRRGKETGVRKVLGASKRNIILQFQTESIIITSLSAILAFLIIFFLFPSFEELTGKAFVLTQFSWESIVLIIGFILVLGCFTGIYPSAFLSSFRSISLLKFGNTLPQKQGNFRRALVIFQFSITLAMIIGSLTVFEQVSYIQNKNIGLERGNLIRAFSYDMDPIAQYQQYKNDLLSKPGIENVTMVDQLLIDIRNTTSAVEWEGKQETDDLEFYQMQANPDFLPTMKIELKEGRNFNWKIQSDTNHYIINEAAQKLMGLTDPLGTSLTFWGQKGKIIGVIKDFHNASLHSEIKPMVIRNQMRSSWMILVRSKPGMNEQALESLEETFYAYNPNRTFWYRFLDDIYNSKYRNELLVRELSLYFTIISIAISLLGLISLVAYSTERRTKEIGIRKVLGASVLNILKLLSSEYLRLLFFATVIAIPVSFVVMANWLEGYAYRINLDWWLFASSTASILFLAILVIGIQTRRVATANPVESLKDE